VNNNQTNHQFQVIQQSPVNNQSPMNPKNPSGGAINFMEMAKIGATLKPAKKVQEFENQKEEAHASQKNYEPSLDKSDTLKKQTTKDSESNSTKPLIISAKPALPSVKPLLPKVKIESTGDLKVPPTLPKPQLVKSQSEVTDKVATLKPSKPPTTSDINLSSLGKVNFAPNEDSPVSTAIANFSTVVSPLSTLVHLTKSRPKSKMNLRKSSQTLGNKPIVSKEKADDEQSFLNSLSDNDVVTVKFLKLYIKQQLDIFRSSLGQYTK
jgi:hypothetical protein